MEEMQSGDKDYLMLHQMGLFLSFRCQWGWGEHETKLELEKSFLVCIEFWNNMTQFADF